eukprot:COSAG02_NODE_39453_length_417_cov_0.610063_1_plen_86_part_01
MESLRSQVKRLRRFPSVATFLYSSDSLPPPRVEQAYLDVFRAERWSVGLISSAVRMRVCYAFETSGALNNLTIRSVAGVQAQHAHR